MRVLSRNIAYVASLSLLVGVSACEFTNSGVNDTSIDLDGPLTDLVTGYGQRSISNFILPESNDFFSIPQDPANPLTTAKVELGRLLFHETALATRPRHPEGMGTYACATCHHAGAGFQAGRKQAVADGGVGWGTNGEGRKANPAYDLGDVDALKVKSPSVLNSAFQQLMMWNGRMGAVGPNLGTEASWVPGSDTQENNLGYQGLETQAIAALRVHRLGDVEHSVVTTNPYYVQLWQAAFPGQPVSRELAGLAIAAYERTVMANRAPFQRWLRGDLEAMTPQEKRGAILFFGKAGCEDVCHTGPALNILEFYALGMPDMSGPGVIGPTAEDFGRGGFTGKDEEEFKYKVPQLYNLKDSPFLGHGGMFASIREIVDYYNQGIPDKSLPGGRLINRFIPLHLTEAEVEDLVTFLTDGLYDADLDRYVPDALPSGNCTPANDPLARIQLGCD